MVDQVSNWTGHAPPAPRDGSCDGLCNPIETILLARGRPLWSIVNLQPWPAHRLNRITVANAVLKTPVRPQRLGTMGDYLFMVIVDRAKPFLTLPAADARVWAADGRGVAGLVCRAARWPPVSMRSTLLFPSVAQWFNDGFLMTSSSDRRRTITNHQIDLSQIHGHTTAGQTALQLNSEERGRKGRLLPVMHGVEECASLQFSTSYAGIWVTR